MKLLHDLQGVKTQLSVSFTSQRGALCRCADKPKADIRTISCRRRLYVLLKRSAPVSQLFNSSNVVQLKCDVTRPAGTTTF